MEEGLFYLAHLVQTKNNLNRERRRHHEIFSPSARWYDAVTGKRISGYESREVMANYRRNPHKGFSKRAAKKAYKNAQAEMKAMTAHMREVRTELGAHFVWGWSGNILAIVHDNKRYDSKDIARLSNWHLADSILLG